MKFLFLGARCLSALGWESHEIRNFGLVPMRGVALWTRTPVLLRARAVVSHTNRRNQKNPIFGFGPGIPPHRGAKCMWHARTEDRNTGRPDSTIRFTSHRRMRAFPPFEQCKWEFGVPTQEIRGTINAHRMGVGPVPWYRDGSKRSRVATRQAERSELETGDRCTATSFECLWCVAVVNLVGSAEEGGTSQHDTKTGRSWKSATDPITGVGCATVAFVLKVCRGVGVYLHTSSISISSSSSSSALLVHCLIA